MENLQDLTQEQEYELQDKLRLEHNLIMDDKIKNGKSTQTVYDDILDYACNYYRWNSMQAMNLYGMIEVMIDEGDFEVAS